MISSRANAIATDNNIDNDFDNDINNNNYIICCR